MEHNQQIEETEIDLRRLFAVMFSKWRTIIIVGVLGALIAGLISIYTIVAEPKIIPTYKSTTSLQVEYYDYEEKNQQVDAFIELIRSRLVAAEVMKELKIEMPTEEFLETLSVQRRKNTNILDITAFSSNPKLARDIADGIRDAGTRFIVNAMHIESFKTIEEANLPKDPIMEERDDEEFNNIFTKVIIGGFLGALGAMFVIFTRFALNDRIQTTEDVERYLGKSVLASIPAVDEPGDNEASR